MGHGIGIDIGGTFIDVVVADSRGLRIAKTPSTPHHAAEGVIRVLGELVERGEIVPEEVGRIIHGSTVATNALLEGKWAKTALVTTRGFRDVLEIGRQNRPGLYDLDVHRPSSIVPRNLRFEVTERVTSSGEIETPLSLEEVRALIPLLQAASVEAVAVVFLFSYLRPDHECAARDALAAAMNVPIILSSEILPEFREYERTSTSVVSAGLRPVVGRYLGALEDGSAKLGLPRRWQVMQSSGAIMSVEAAEGKPDRLLLSGPAGGVQGARAIGVSLGEVDLITMDMGGTSCDVSLVSGGAISWTSTGQVGGYPLATPMAAIHTIGAGGGSVAWIDSGGALRVGPQSVGADPGPACYGRGGESPTVTDAHLALGHLLPMRPLGGLDALDLEASRRAIENRVAEPLGMSCEAAALGILEVADAAMERAIRVVSVERGSDPRGYALLAFGGAGPLHGISIARRLAIPRVIVPWAAGVLSAFGLLVAETGHDLSQSLLRPLSNLDAAVVADVLESLKAQGLAMLRAEGFDVREMRFQASADLRYLGQSHELNVAIDEGASGGVDLARTREAFDRVHRERYGHASPDEAVELVTVRLRASGPPVKAETRRAVLPEVSRRPVEMWKAWFDPSGPVVTRVVDRGSIPPGEWFYGPMVILGDDATVLVPPSAGGRANERGDLVLEVG